MTASFTTWLLSLLMHLYSIINFVIFGVIAKFAKKLYKLYTQLKAGLQYKGGVRNSRGLGLTWLPHTCILPYTIYTEIFVGEIFRGLNFRRVKFSRLKPPTKIGHHKNFAPLTVYSMERWLLSSEKKLCVCGYHVYDIWEAAVGEMWEGQGKECSWQLRSGRR